MNAQSDLITTLKSQADAQSDQLSSLQTENGNLALQNGKLIAQNKLLAGEMNRIATAAHLDAAPTGSAQQLADAIIEKLSGVSTRVSALEQRNPNGLYDGVKAIATVGSSSDVNPADNSVLLNSITAVEQLDFGKTFYLQWAAIRCSPTNYNAAVSFGAERHFEYSNVHCKIIGRAP
jgi:hypothetical protein